MSKLASRVISRLTFRLSVIAADLISDRSVISMTIIVTATHPRAIAVASLANPAVRNPAPGGAERHPRGQCNYANQSPSARTFHGGEYARVKTLKIRRQTAAHQT